MTRRIPARNVTRTCSRFDVAPAKSIWYWHPLRRAASSTLQIHLSRAIHKPPPPPPPPPPPRRIASLDLCSPQLSSSSLSSSPAVSRSISSMASKRAEAAGGSGGIVVNSSGGGEPSPADVYSSEMTPLQNHVAFFDRNKDGIIYPSETYEGLRAIGAGVALSAAGALFINGGLGPKTIPDNAKARFKLPIYINNIHKGKHGSDSGVYDENGRLVDEKFEQIFKKHAHTRPDALTGQELKELLQANREPKDFKGRLGGFAEWKVLFYLCKDKDGFLHKDTVRAVYDGSLFVKMEQDRRSAKKK